MTVGAFHGSAARYVGNVRDLLAMICNAKEDGWVLEFGCGGWRVRIAPMFDGQAPYKMSIATPAGIEASSLHGAESVSRAVESAVTFLRTRGVADVPEQQMVAIAAGIDSREALPRA